MGRFKFVLIVGDNEEGIIGREEKELLIRDVGCNFDHSPSIAALYEVYSDEAKKIVLDIRGEGLKVGIYASREKAQGFFWKALGSEWMGSAVSLDTIKGKNH